MNNENESVKIDVIDNGGQWTHRIWRLLRDLGCETEIVSNETSVNEITADALVLSGGAPRIAWETPKLGMCMDYLDNFKGPILGICVGHQLMAINRGGKAGPSSIPEFGLMQIEVLNEDELFKGIPKEFFVWESHNDEVKEASEFIILAKSQGCAIQAMRHKEKPFFGIQFHAEVNDTQYGEEIYKNFIQFVKKFKTL